MYLYIKKINFIQRTSDTEALLKSNQPWSYVKICVDSLDIYRLMIKKRRDSIQMKTFSCSFHEKYSQQRNDTYEGEVLFVFNTLVVLL